MHRRYAVAEQVDDPEYERRNHKYAERQLPVRVQEENGRCREQGKRLNHHSDDPCDHMADGIEVSRQTRHQIAGTVGAVKRHILPLNFVIQVIPHPVQDTLRYVLVNHTAAVDDDDAQKREANHRNQQAVKQIPVCLQILYCIFPGQKQVDDFSRKIRNRKLQNVI